MFRKDLVVETKSVDVKQRIVPVVASTAIIDSHEEIVEQVWDLERYSKNPVVLWNHNRIFQQDTRPIGRAEDVRVENEGTDDAALKANLRMASKEANEHAHSVLLLFAEGIQNAVSVGFNPRDIRREVRSDRDIIVLSDNQLLEISATPIGANEDALQEQRAAELSYIKEHLGGVVVIGRAVVPYHAFPPITGKWDGRAAERRVREWAGGDNINWTKYRQAFTWYDSSNPEVFDSHKLPHHDVVDGGLKTHRDGVIAAGGAVQGARGGVDIPDSEMPRVRSHLGKHYRQFDMQPPWERAYELQDSTSPLRGDDNTGETYMADLKELQTALEKALAENAKLKAENEEIASTLKDTASEIKAYQSQVKRLSEERDTAIARAEKAESASKEASEAKEKAEQEAEVDALVGVKISPAEKDTFLRLRHDNPNLFKDMVKQRREMTYLERSVGADRDPDAGNSHKRIDDDGASASDALTSEAYG